ncbi:MAG: hypothetical protein CL855_00520 [Cryomorphaceae bacterium]|nr:hypothetical protein [Cryomorphaceae bacterium]
MPYIGKQLVRGQNRKLDDISSGFNGSQTTFTLQIASQNVSVGSALQLWISVGGVIQNPLTDFTIAGNQITFTTAPAASLDFFGVIQGDVTDTNTPGDATVTTSKLATGLTVNLADGSAATSSLQLGGTDSGLFSSAADKVNVTTGGVERLEIGSSEVVFNDGSNDVDFRVESNGNSQMLFVDAGNDRVGIGTASPANNLDLAIDSNNEGIRLSSSTNVFGKIDFHSNRSGADAALGIIDFNWNGTQVARIIGGAGTDTTNKDDGALQFHTAAAGSATEAMRIDSSGRLLLNGGSDVRMELGTNGTTGTNDRNHIRADGDILKYNCCDNGQHIFEENGTERMRIDSSGNVGIGNSTPSSYNAVADDLVVGNQSGAHGITIAAENNNTGYLHWADGTGSTAETRAGRIAYSHADNSFRFDTAASERMRLDSSGRLLVGTSSGTSSPNAIQTGGGGTMISSSGSISNNGTLDLTVGTSNICFWSGFLFVNNIDAANGLNRTQSTFSVFADNQNASSQFTQIASRNGSSSRSFTVTYVDNGIIRITNTSGSTCNVSAGFFGGGINMG